MAKGKKNSSLKLLLTLCSCTLALVALILLLATNSVVYTLTSQVLGGKSKYEVSGIAGIFGGTDAKYAMSWAGLLSFIFVAAALVLVVLLVVLALLKKKIGFAGLLKFIAAGLLIAGGVLVFFEVAAFKAANGDNAFNLGSLATGTYSLGVGWIIAAILSIVSGAGLIVEEIVVK